MIKKAADKMHSYQQPNGSCRSDGQALAALGTAAGENLAAVLGSHALQETVHTAALTLLGLECTLHLNFPPVQCPVIGFFGSAQTRGSLADYDYTLFTPHLSTLFFAVSASCVQKFHPPLNLVIAVAENFLHILYRVLF